MKQCCLLCGGHHKQLHDGRLLITGQAPELKFAWRPDEGVETATTSAAWEFVEEPALPVPRGTLVDEPALPVPRGTLVDEPALPVSRGTLDEAALPVPRGTLIDDELATALREIMGTPAPPKAR